MKPLLAALNRQPTKHPPIWLMRQAGRYLPEYRDIRRRVTSFLELCYTPELATEVTLQPIRRFGLDAAILFSDILVVPHALGRNVRFLEGEGPQLDPVETDRDVDALTDGFRMAVLDPVIETVTRLRAALDDQTALIGFAGAPWTVACYMIDGSTSRDWPKSRHMAFGAPDRMDRLLAALVECTERYLVRQVEAGAEVVQLFESWAGILPDTAFERFVIRPTADLVERLRQRFPTLPIVGFPRGAGALYETYARGTGVVGVSLDSTVPLSWARERLAPTWVVQGNLDPMLLVVGGSAMDRSARRIVEQLGPSGFIFNLGHGVVPETPPGHVEALVRTVRSL